MDTKPKRRVVLSSDIVPVFVDETNEGEKSHRMLLFLSMCVQVGILVYIYGVALQVNARRVQLWMDRHGGFGPGSVRMQCKSHFHSFRVCSRCSNSLLLPPPSRGYTAPNGA